MNINNRPLDRFFYLILCILSLGFVYLCRLIITEAIKQAFKDDK